VSRESRQDDGRPFAAPRFFADGAAFRAWLEAHGEEETELAVGFHAVASGRPSLTWPEAVAEALCFGWIDGVRRRIDAESYQIRFTPRRRGSTWSAVNIALAEELIRTGRMAAAGMRAFDLRTEKRSRTYSYEQEEGSAFAPAEEKLFRANPLAWAHFMQQPPSFREKAIWWVISAKRESTRATRLEKLIDASAAGRRLKGAE
jgi:uncharacterized protein YdeI (YjbR/CyaY-like superfamily)